MGVVLLPRGSGIDRTAARTVDFQWSRRVGSPSRTPRGPKQVRFFRFAQTLTVGDYAHPVLQDRKQVFCIHETRSGSDNG